jgi:hypothetical protein
MNTQEQARDNSTVKVEATEQMDELSENTLNSIAGGRDAASGLPSGKRMYKPLTITAG